MAAGLAQGERHRAALDRRWRGPGRGHRRGGQIDLTWDLPRVGLAQLESNPAVKVISVRTPYVMSMSMWVDTPPFDDLRVRQALKYTITGTRW